MSCRGRIVIAVIVYEGHNIRAHKQNGKQKVKQQVTTDTTDATMESCPGKRVSGSLNTSFCLHMAIHVLQNEAQKGLNFVFSPISFHSMLSLLAVGSKGSTLEQLLFFLGLKCVDELSSLASQIFTLVYSPVTDTKEGPIISFVNGTWIDQSFHLKPSFREVVEGVYGATAKEVDFVNKAHQVVNEVNLWAENATKGLIKDLLPCGCLRKNTALLLANALYFKGSWDRKFDASKTEVRDFYLHDGHVVEVPFMTMGRYERNFYGSFDGYKVLKLPYQGRQDTCRQFAMYFFLPNARDGLENLAEKFQTDPAIFNCNSELSEEELNRFWIPRFKFSFEFEASSTMKEMGLELAFETVGELTEMVDSPRSPVLSEIFHKSFIEVDEEGTEAAASTALTMRWCCGRLDPPTFVADHPFLFSIKEENSGAVFFTGAVLNPLLCS